METSIMSIFSLINHTAKLSRTILEFLPLQSIQSPQPTPLQSLQSLHHTAGRVFLAVRFIYSKMRVENPTIPPKPPPAFRYWRYGLPANNFGGTVNLLAVRTLIITIVTIIMFY